MASKKTAIAYWVAVCSLGLIIFCWPEKKADAVRIKDLYGTCLSGKCNTGKKEVFTDDAQSLLLNLASKPELMNIAYLHYALGEPSNGKTQHGLAEKTYYWLDELRQIKYELHQSEHVPGQITASTFIMHLQNSGLTYDKLESMVGGVFQRYYDNNGHPCERISLAPYTYLHFSAPQNTFRLGKAEISYQGPPLGQPSAEDWQVVKDRHLANAANAHTNGNWQQLHQYSMKRVADNPQDATAHMWLGKALAKQGHLNEAINEYEKAMALAGTQSQIYSECLADLAEFKVIRDLPERKELVLTHKGQHLRTGDNQSPQKQKSNNTGLAQSGNWGM